MGTSLTSIHVFGNNSIANCDYSFRSFSPNWLTCVNDFSEKAPDFTYKAAQTISKKVDAPVLYFGVFDSEMLWFDFFRNGKVVARYSDKEFVPNKKLFDIPSLIGYGNGQKKRLSSLLSCSDTDTKIAMLEEYFGVCLLFLPELLDQPDKLVRERDDKLYQKYQAEEKALTGKAAPVSLNLIAEYPGKLFLNAFGKPETIKPHFFLYGYTSEDDWDEDGNLTPVKFTGNSLETSDFQEFEQDRIPRILGDPRFQIHYRTSYQVTFSEECPADYRGKTMILPNGSYPVEFLPSGELLLRGNHRVYVADPTLKIIAKLTIKGDIADVLGDHILTTTGDSFYVYGYEPKAKIYIYEVVKK